MTAADTDLATVAAELSEKGVGEYELVTPPDKEAETVAVFEVV